MTILFPIIYSAALTYLVWAFKVVSNGWGISKTEKKAINNSSFQKKLQYTQNF